MNLDDPSPFAGTTPVASLAHSDGVVTLVEGQTFCLSGRTGDMSTCFPHGLFVLDTRVRVALGPPHRRRARGAAHRRHRRPLHCHPVGTLEVRVPAATVAPETPTASTIPITTA